MAKELEQDRHTEDLGPDLEVGHDPFGDADPGSCDATPSECEVRPHEFDGPPERSQVQITEELMEPYVPVKTVFGTNAEDGLPEPLNEGSELHEAPPLRYDNFICIEDARTFVEVFAGEEESAVDSSVSRWLDKNGHRLAPRGMYSDGQPQERREFKPEDVRTAFGRTYVAIDGEAVLVRPTRPRCEHLRRQVLHHAGVPEGEPGHFIVFRNCNVRRSVGGALMSLRDEAIYACDYRNPPDLGSVKKYIDDPEKKQLEKTPVRLPMFTGPAVPLPGLES